MYKVIVKEIESGFVHETLFVSFSQAEAIERGYRNDDFYRVVISRYQNVRGLGQNKNTKEQEN